MQILNAINITSLVKGKYKGNTNTLPLSAIEEQFTGTWLDEGSFCIFKVTFSDGEPVFYFDYPTDMNEEQAIKTAEEALAIYPLILTKEHDMGLDLEQYKKNAEELCNSTKKDTPALTAEELTNNAKLLYKQLAEMYDAPEGERTGDFYQELSGIWSKFRVVSGDLVKTLISQGKL